MNVGAVVDSSSSSYLASGDLAALVADLRKAFNSGRTRPLDWRLEQLASLRRMLIDKEQVLLDALREDVGKPKLEAYSADISVCVNEIDHIRKKLRSWLKPEKVSTSMVAQPGKSRIVREPLGVVLIIGAWNYPVQLNLVPLIGAISGGNCAVVKPSEIAPATSRLLAELLPQYLDQECVRVVEGAVPETTALLEQKFDHIFYTGNGTVARIIMSAAAKHLTPVTLELGGKSPCIVDQSADLDVTARRIVWGKFFNAGQTCVAPDYILAHRAIYESLLEKITSTLLSFYGEDPQRSPDYARIVNLRHYRRVWKLLENSNVVVGGTGDEGERYIAPTVLRDVAADAPVMNEEIFGPILPVLPVEDMEQAVAFVNARNKPLALYVFSSNASVQELFVSRTSAGGVTINHAWMHVAVPELPFGGVGESGMGAYHGRRTFETYVHQKAVLSKPTYLDPSLIYPPYSEKERRLLRKIL